MNDTNLSVYKTIGYIYHQLEDYENASKYMKTFKFNASYSQITAEDYNLLGFYYERLYTTKTRNIKDLDKAVSNFIMASDRKPNDKNYLKNVTITASKGNMQKLADRYWKKLLKLGGLTNDDKFDYAAHCLKNGDFKGFEKYYEYRFDKETNPTVIPIIHKPKWDGDIDLSDKTLLVCYEQGFGDTILMAGYLPRLVKLAKHIIYVVQDALYTLLKDNSIGVEVIPANRFLALNDIKYDYYIPSMSIPMALKLNRDNISVGEGYIKPNEDKVKEYKEKYFKNNKLKIGLSVSGNKNGDTTRDIPLDMLLPLTELDNVQLYNLTKDIEIDNPKIINLGKTFNNFADTAEAMANCDIVISTDNVLMNLAGAIGKKTFGLFNYSNQFRYFDLTGDDIVWYTSVKPFVCNDVDNWKYVIDLIIKEIK